ncbi:MAG TPA: MBL fold metallo-hydrolase [Chloroflexota bacterium]
MGALSAHAREGGAPEVRELGGGIYAYLQPDWTWMLNNAGFIVGRDAVTVIDTCGTEPRTSAYLAAIRKITDKPLRTLINTHHHGDHTYGNHLLLPAATIVGHELCRAEVQRVGLGIKPLFPGVEWGSIEVAPPFVTFEQRVNVYVDELRIELIYVGPAHTKGDVVAWIPERKLLFTGDIVFNDCTPFVAEGCIEHFFDALAALRALGAERVVPGHGEIGGPDMFDKVEAYLRFVQAAAGELLGQGLLPLEAARRLDLGPYASWPDSERIVGNLARAYSELRGEPWGTTLDLAAIAQDMMAYHGGPLRCLA